MHVLMAEQKEQVGDATSANIRSAGADCGKKSCACNLTQRWGGWNILLRRMQVSRLPIMRGQATEYYSKYRFKKYTCAECKPEPKAKPLQKWGKDTVERMVVARSMRFTYFDSPKTVKSFWQPYLFSRVSPKSSA